MLCCSLVVTKVTRSVFRLTKEYGAPKEYRRMRQRVRCVDVRSQLTSALHSVLQPMLLRYEMIHRWDHYDRYDPSQGSVSHWMLFIITLSKSAIPCTSGC